MPTPTSYRVKVNLPKDHTHDRFVESQKHSFSIDARRSDDARTIAKARVVAMGLTVRSVNVGPDQTVIVNAFDPATMSPLARAR